MIIVDNCLVGEKHCVSLIDEDVITLKQMFDIMDLDISDLIQTKEFIVFFPALKKIHKTIFNMGIHRNEFESIRLVNNQVHIEMVDDEYTKAIKKKLDNKKFKLNNNPVKLTARFNSNFIIVEIEHDM